MFVHLLAAFGAAVSGKPYAKWSGRSTSPRLYVLVIGSTGAGKGLGGSLATDYMRGADPEWSHDG